LHDHGRILDKPFRHDGWRDRLFAWCLGRTDRQQASLLTARKRLLFADLAGTVLEIGPGTGANLSLYPPHISWIGIEPNPYMHPLLRRRAAAMGPAFNLCRGLAEQLAVGSESVDAVISTHVLCSVRNLSGALAEILRVLRPAGRFLFLEHVSAAPGTWLQSCQKWLRPAWQVLAGGCRPDRDIEAELRVAGFARVDVRAFRVPIPVISPHIMGVAVKAEAIPSSPPSLG
jgi:ubiquinone/menaquinone biosynthesis C-methylase UbiE